MKRIACLSALAFVIGIGAAAHADATGFQGVKLGGGVLWNDDVPASMHSTGGSFHASADIKAIGPLAVTPFYEVSRRNGTNTILAGGEIHYSIPLTETGADFYVGPGAGIAHGNGETKFHVNAVAGVTYPLTRTVGVFAQSKYVWAAGGLVNGMSGYTGLTLSMPY